MASSGFVTNFEEIGGITGSYESALLSEDVTLDDNALHGALPQECYLDHLEFTINKDLDKVTDVSVFLTWDDVGNHLLWPVTTVLLASMTGGFTTTTLRSYSVPLDLHVRAPAAQTTTGAVYLWIKATVALGGEITLKRARLYWTNPHERA